LEKVSSLHIAVDKTATLPGVYKLLQAACITCICTAGPVIGQQLYAGMEE